MVGHNDPKTGWWMGPPGNYVLPTPIRIAVYSLAPNRQRPFAGAFNAAIYNTFRRCKHQVLYVVPPFLVAYAAMGWANERGGLSGLREGLEIVPPADFQKAHKAHLAAEKSVTHALQNLSSTRRSLPVTQIPNPERFKFDTPTGEKTLPDLFGPHKQLIMYHFMLGPEDEKGCVGCSFCMDHIPNLWHLESRDTTFVAVAEAGIDKIEEYKKRMGWGFPFYSSAKTVRAWGVAEGEGEVITWKPGNGYFGLCVFLKGTGGEVFHTYSTTDRGMEILLGTYHLLDMTPLGRQEVGNGMNDFRRIYEY
ncbi:uncharacterized protein BDW43DRAFT_306718 [Aspergillus alliaceus]|uniref:uncharacterized protein n=1 Tax=Petromyces alliaceus TaxID=209559 RepID=UPI0012A6BCB7|nr:uncharacterized protein BDW43DRAFT_306718 [Aspergillus alliaceus]KAB8238019.1 hypothetical protein BDW43DRAFT_306718 [Aspergillus alliaceus]